MCYATLESIASGGDSDDDYANVGTLDQRAPVTYTPNRLIEGSSQILNILGGKQSLSAAELDKLVFTQQSDCSGLPSGASSTQTQEYNIADNDDYATLSSGLAAGTYQMCYKPSTTGLWTLVTGNDLTIIGKPTMSPEVGLAGSITNLTLSGSTDGDFIVISADCSQPQAVVDGVGSMVRVSIVGGLVRTTTVMVANTTLQVCIASAESGGDSADDYVALGQTLTQRTPPSFLPIRIVKDAAQQIVISNAHVDDSLGWSIDDGCNAMSPEAINALPYNSIINALAAGTYRLCYKPSAAGAWTPLAGDRLTVIAKPTFTPVTAVAG